MKESDISFSFLCRPPNKNSQFTKLVMKICYMVCLKLQEHYTMEKWQDFVFLHVPLFHRQRIKANITFSCHTSGLCFFTCARFLQEVQRQSSSNETMNSGQTNKRFSAISPRWKGSTSLSAVSWESFIPFFAFRSIHTKSCAAISITAKQEWSFVRAWKLSYGTTTPVYEELNVKTWSLPIYTRQDSDAHRSQSYFDLHTVPSRQVFWIRSFLCENPCISEFLFSSSSSSSNSTLSVSSCSKGNASDAMAKQVMVRKSRMAVILFIVFYAL